MSLPLMGVGLPLDTVASSGPPTPTAFWTFNSTLADNTASPANFALTSGASGSAYVAGIVGNAVEIFPYSVGKARFAPWLQATGSKLNPGSGSFSFAGWYKKNAVSSTELMTVIAWVNDDAHGIYANDTFFSAGNNIGVRLPGAGKTILAGAVAASNNTWYFTVLTYNSGTTTLSLSVNNGTPVTIGSANPAGFTNTIYCLRDQLSNGTANFGNQWGWWTGHVLTSTEISFLYNSGSGKTWNGSSWV